MPKQAKERRSSLPFQRRQYFQTMLTGKAMKRGSMTTKPILLVEDTPDDAELTIMSLKHSGLLNDVVVAEDGLEALDYLFGQGRYAGRNPLEAPPLVPLDIKMPRLDGIEVLQRLRADKRTSVL